MLPSLQAVLSCRDVALEVLDRIEALEQQFEWGVPSYAMTDEELAAKDERQALVKQILDEEAL